MFRFYLTTLFAVASALLLSSSPVFGQIGNSGSIEGTLKDPSGAAVPERAIAVIVLAPAVLEAYRYFRPESAWARWAMRAVEAGSVLLVIKR